MFLFWGCWTITKYIYHTCALLSSLVSFNIFYHKTNIYFSLKFFFYLSLSLSLSRSLSHIITIIKNLKIKKNVNLATFLDKTIQNFSTIIFTSKTIKLTKNRKAKMKLKKPINNNSNIIHNSQSFIPLHSVLVQPQNTTTPPSIVPSSKYKLKWKKCIPPKIQNKNKKIIKLKIFKRKIKTLTELIYASNYVSFSNVYLYFFIHIPMWIFGLSKVN